MHPITDVGTNYWWVYSTRVWQKLLHHLFTLIAAYLQTHNGVVLYYPTIVFPPSLIRLSTNIVAHPSETFRSPSCYTSARSAMMHNWYLEAVKVASSRWQPTTSTSWTSIISNPSRVCIWEERYIPLKLWACPHAIPWPKWPNLQERNPSLASIITPTVGISMRSIIIVGLGASNTWWTYPHSLRPMANNYVHCVCTVWFLTRENSVHDTQLGMHGWGCA